MTEVFDIENFKPLESLHDFVSSSIELRGNCFILLFNHICAETEEGSDKGRLRVTYVLNQDFEKWDKLTSSVREIDYRKRLRRNIFKYMTLRKMVEKLNNQNKSLNIQSQYYKKGFCLICAEAQCGKLTEAGHSFYINLMVDKIIYEWI